MKTINRAAVVVQYREPFLRWAARVDVEALSMAESLRDGLSVYLVPEDPNQEQETAPLEQFFLDIFERELEDWCPDEALWPVLRDLATFREWFEVTGTSVVVDLARGPVRHDSL